jgi:hypothetical protein
MSTTPRCVLALALLLAAVAAAPPLAAQAPFADDVLFADDFSGATAGQFPASLQFVEGPMEVAEREGRSFLRSTGRSVFRVPLADTLPEGFIVEFDVMLTGGSSSDRLVVSTQDLTRPQIRQNRTPYFQVAHFGTGIGGPSRTLASRHDLRDRLIPVRIEVDGRSASMTVDGRNAGNVPTLDLRRADYLVMRLEGSRGASYLTNVRVTRR